MAVTSPFGQSIDYDPGWVGRYLVTRAELRTVDIEFALAAKLSAHWSIGGGIDWQNAHLSRTSALDFGAICFGSVGPAGCTALGLVPQGTDGRVNIAGNSNAWGYNLGVLYEIPGSLRVGLTYRAKMMHEFHGDAMFDVPGAAAPLLAGGTFRDTGASSTLTLPETLSVATVYRATDRLSLLASIAWTRWSRIDQLVVTFDNPAQAPTRESLGWKDQARAGIAMDYVLEQPVTLHAGIAWERSPIPADRRLALLPESNQWILGVGATWNISPASYIVAAYNYHSTRDVTITQSAPGAGTLRGVYSIALQGLGVSAGVRF
jgi:long-chain fatty acid transport protein